MLMGPLFVTASAVQAGKGLALQDLVLVAYDFIGTLELTPEARVYLLEQLASTKCVALYCALVKTLL